MNASARFLTPVRAMTCRVLRCRPDGHGRGALARAAALLLVWASVAGCLQAGRSPDELAAARQSSEAASDSLSGTFPSKFRPAPMSFPPMADESVDAARPGVCDDAEAAFDVLQARVFDQHGCSARACHGETMAAGLCLSQDRAYDAIVGADAKFSNLPLVSPGAPDQSFVYQKLRAGTEPGSVRISGSPMPAGLAPLSPDELSAVAAWILAGASRTGPVAAPPGRRASGDYVAETLCRGSEDPGMPSGLDRPVLELDAPAPEEGYQFRMPAQPLAAGSEAELCFATYSELADGVPDEFGSADGEHFFVDSTVIQLSPGGHHLSTFNVPAVTTADLTDPAFGEWACNGGDRDGGGCDPTDIHGCGEAGLCMSSPGPYLGCIGYGPAHSNVNPASFGVGTALSPSERVPRIEGVYREVPIRGVLYWNFHAFNLAEEDRLARGRINVTYAKDREELEARVIVNGALDGPHSVPPFSRQRLCNDWVVPQGAKILRLTSHTHQRGSNFRIWDPAGEMIYESFDYETPAYVAYEPAMTFDAADPAARTLRFCADFNNGVGPDGSPDLDTLVQVSRIPDYELFKPFAEACSTGAWGVPCLPLFGDAQCDTAPGAGDGKCDAASIHFGQTSGLEMFMMAVDIVMPPTVQRTGTLFDSTFWGTPLPNMELP